MLEREFSGLYKVTAAIRRVKTMANALLRDVYANGPKAVGLHAMKSLNSTSVLSTRNSTTKIRFTACTNLHEPEVSCIGKAHKKYEFGSKAAIAVTKTGGIIVGAKNFSGNPSDGDTLKDTINDAINLLLAAAAFNFRKWMRALASTLYFVLIFL